MEDLQNTSGVMFSDVERLQCIMGYNTDKSVVYRRQADLHHGAPPVVDVVRVTELKPGGLKRRHQIMFNINTDDHCVIMYPPPGAMSSQTCGTF